jgi:hypothetical protein
LGSWTRSPPPQGSSWGHRRDDEDKGWAGWPDWSTAFGPSPGASSGSPARGARYTRPGHRRGASGVPMELVGLASLRRGAPLRGRQRSRGRSRSPLLSLLREHAPTSRTTKGSTRAGTSTPIKFRATSRIVVKVETRWMDRLRPLLIKNGAAPRLAQDQRHHSARAESAGPGGRPAPFDRNVRPSQPPRKAPLGDDTHVASQQLPEPATPPFAAHSSALDFRRAVVHHGRTHRAVRSLQLRNAPLGD